MKLDIIKPKIFPENKIIAGVTEKNIHIHPQGFSFVETQLIDTNTAQLHRKLLANFLSITPDDFAFLKQTHSDVIHFVDSSFTMKEGDALITKEKGKVLVVKIADCAGILVYDPRNQVIAAIHSGWRGSSKRITFKTINLLVKEFGTNPKDALVYVSPVPSVLKYEVGEEVAKLFPRTTIKTSNGKYFFDNKKEILFQLLECGVKEENIEISPLCTISNVNLHSYRRDREKSGRMACFIGMRK
ncbi:MAG: peptidoglycan editing factor PgeF [Ignavibacteria bacterium]|nr:peptidoglycan editing factor PgeF [Ignavibacteria bacterium]